MRNDKHARSAQMRNAVTNLPSSHLPRYTSWQNLRSQSAVCIFRESHTLLNVIPNDEARGKDQSKQPYSKAIRDRATIGEWRQKPHAPSPESRHAHGKLAHTATTST